MFEFSASQFALGGLIASTAIFITIWTRIWMLIGLDGRQEKKNER